jgi:chemosensory pili system protein ChpA (sensor histidine kinase/response regulator)
MAAQLQELRRVQPELSPTTHAFLDQWPALLFEYVVAPDDAVTAEALVEHLGDPHWPSPLLPGERDSLLQLLHGSAGMADLPPLVGNFGAAVNDGSASCRVFDDGNELVDHAVAEADYGGVDAASSEALLEEVSAIFACAEQAGSVALQEICMHVMQNLSLFPEAEMRHGTPVRTMLDQFSALARSCLASPQDSIAAERLAGFLGAELWPEPLAPGDLERLRLMLLHGQGEQASGSPEPEAASAATGIDSPGERAPVGGAILDEPVDVRMQTTSDDLVAMLSAELSGMRNELDQMLAGAVAVDSPSAENIEAAEGYAEILERLGTAADAIGLVALKSFLTSLHQRLRAITAQGFSEMQCSVLAMLPGSMLAYLAAPSDLSTCEGLLDLLRGDVWPQPPAPAHVASLTRALSMVEVSGTSADAETRQAEARPEDVSLALPNDLSQDLLDGLLQEMPVQTGEFSAAIQRIVGGSGTLQDVDAAKRAAHTLKGAANTVGIKGIANLTHHVEDILVALSKHEVLPGRALGEMLTNAGDCLEAMGEALMGVGPAPDYAVGVLQDVLNWANQIDREGIPRGDAAIQPAGDSDSAKENSPVVEAGAASTASAQAGEAMVRIPASLVDELLRLVGETIISTGQVRERLQRLLRQNRAIREQNGVFLQLANELEELVDLRGAAAGFGAARADDEFDPLEFEHYGELHTVSRRLIEAATDTKELSAEVEFELSNLGELVEVQNRLHEESQNAVMRTRMVPVSTVVSRLQRSVRQAARLLDKRVALTVHGADTMIDSNILNELVDPLMHMLRNAVDHGIETPDRRTALGKEAEGRIDLAFSREGNQVVVRCRDDGAGLDLPAVRRTAQNKGLLTDGQDLSEDELGRLILVPGFSTRTESTQVSGRGVGMDVVYSRVLQLKGGLNLLNSPGKGLEIELHLPAVLISTHALLVRSRARVFAVSSYGVQDIRYVLQEQVQKVGGESFFRSDKELFPLLDLDNLLNLPGERRADDRQGGFPVILVRGDSGAVHAVRVQEIIDSCSLVVKNLGPYVPKPHGVVGATILGDGSVAAVIDVPELMRKPARRIADPDQGDVQSKADAYTAASQHRLTALVVDDSLSARRATAQFMKDAGFEVRSAIDGLEAVSILAKWKPHVLLVDMEMPRMNGLELTAHVRARPETAQIPVIMITSRSTEKHRRQAEVAGVNVYLTKPFGDDILLRHVTELTGA